jgi:superfamily II DNA or RNA helicase
MLPSEDEHLALLRPLTGATDEVVAVYRPLADAIGYTLSSERIESSLFPPPDASDVRDASALHLFWQAARLVLRDGATPLRSLGHISFRPRVYQFVPLLMALRLSPVRLLITDDVGVGKTVEALLIAKELLERGEVRRVCVLCPPYLCEQWQQEMQQKFGMDAVVIRSGTIGQLERAKLSANQSIYEYYPLQVASIDFIKTEHNRHLFLQYCAELVIVDEVHGAAEASEGNRSQQQRHQLLRDIASRDDRHLILLTATPHSGIEAAFRSILALLRPEFGNWQMGSLDESQRTTLARHFVQRTRKDIQQTWRESISSQFFPERESVDVTYRLSDSYKRLFEETYKFCSEMVRTGEQLEEYKQRVRYWAALALLRCVMSSPEAAVEALQARRQRLQEAEPFGEDKDFSPFVHDTVREVSEDETPIPPIEEAERRLAQSERQRLRELQRMARDIQTQDKDTKASQCVALVRQLLREGYAPVLWCRYVATAEYLGEKMRNQLGDDVQVTVVTGRLSDDERRLKIEEIDARMPRVLVATDCLSEGINLQHKFTAVVHYDLPWNPNRLEQREGRVDRYGQTAPRVKAVRYYSPDNPVDGVVIRVLLDKAREIYRALGTYVPVPEESDSVMEAVMKALFLRSRPSTEQLTLDLELTEETIQALHRKWDEEAARERTNRSRFAQRAIKPEEVQRELESCDEVLGDENAVREFVLNTCQRLQVACTPKGHGIYEIVASPTMPGALREVFPADLRDGRWRVSFVSPTPAGAEYIGRNHRFVRRLAQWLMESALEPMPTDGLRIVSRCGAICTREVSRLTVLLLLRVRYLIEIPQQPALLAEEVVVTGYERHQPNPRWLSRDAAYRLLTAEPSANIPPAEKEELVSIVLQELVVREEPSRWRLSDFAETQTSQLVHDRAKEMETSHKRIRQAVSSPVRNLSVRPQMPPDLLGVLVLQPEVP